MTNAGGSDYPTLTWDGNPLSTDRFALAVQPEAATSEASASSNLDFWVEPFEFHAGVFDAELPVNAALFRVGLV
jgi:hypothetical protein